MMLEEITIGSIIRGIIPNQDITVIQIQWHGDSVISLSFTDQKGNTSTQLIYRHQEASIKIVNEARPLSFNGDGYDFRLAAEAYRISLAYLFDPLLAVSTSLIIPLPHQISAVYDSMLLRQPLRFLLADDPGAGKTIMAGLYIKELFIRGEVKRCMIVAPGNLTEQWQDEMYEKFGIHFELITRHSFEDSPTGNVFNEKNMIICRMDHMSRNEYIQEKLIASDDWDLIIVDEAHKMSASYFTNELKMTKRFLLGRILSQNTRNFLLMTATPHRGKEEDFQIFMSLLDGDRFEGKFRKNVHVVDTSDLMRRLVKEELLTFEGKKLFPERKAYSVKYSLSDLEAKLYALVTEYVREEMNRADRLIDKDGRRRNQVGFALTVLQRRLASSPEAIYQSLQRRKQKLEDRLTEEKLLKRGKLQLVAEGLLDEFDVEDYEEIDEIPDEEMLETEDELVSSVSAAQTIDELEKEIATVTKLVGVAKELRNSGLDRKWEQLSDLIQGEVLNYSDSDSRKLIIFSEHKDTLNYLTKKLRTYYGTTDSVINIHGGLQRDERKKNQDKFKNDKNAIVLVATDAASEGINLQFANLMINYDLPWNPNRIEQRFGRIHRIGQNKVCHLWNLIAYETREGAVFEKLFEKLEIARQALGGKVFDVLGSAFEERSLRALLTDAIKYSDDPQRKIEFEKVVDNALDKEHLLDLLKRNALTNDVLGLDKVISIKEEMEKAEARKLQPHFIEAFFVEAFKKLGGSVHSRENKRYEVIRVPNSVIRRDRQIGTHRPVQPKYHRICFDKNFLRTDGKPEAEFICPGHPLMNAVIDLTKEKSFSLLRQGTILVNEEDYGNKPKVLFFLEHSVKDGKGTDVSTQVLFAEINEDGKIEKVGYAPYLDYRPASETENDLIKNQLDKPWVSKNLEKDIISYAVQNIVPDHLESIRSRRLQYIEKAQSEIKNRLIKEIAHWHHRANELRLKEQAGKNVRMNSGKARARAEVLESRLEERMDDLELEKHLTTSLPVIIGGAFIVPKGLLQNQTDQTVIDSEARRKIEIAAMNAVIEYEKNQGRFPNDVSGQRGLGYDILSSYAEGGKFLFIEVKGVAAQNDNITVTRNELMACLNKKEDFVLAIVKVENEVVADPVFINNPFDKEPDFAQISATYSIKELTKHFRIISIKDI